ncbi:hypothetical protein ACH4L5_34745 [Streptomyces sp. NPDC017405]|uniref:hypothetical protein n=1 Tax=unclassified Streptomyces TaxID=2593676 RepID=UPI00378B1F95
MTDRRPLGTGPATADPSLMRDTDPPPAPRAPLAAERLPTEPADPAAADTPPTRLGRRRALGAGGAAAR